jgi:hypothetical protein
VPMPLPIVVPLLVFAGLVAALIVVARRAGRLLALNRRDDVFRGSVAELADRIDRSLGGVIGRVDAVRRHELEAAAIAENLEAAQDAISRYADEAQALPPAPGPIDPRDSLTIELTRAGRALEMVAHGCSLLLVSAGPTRELEAQTSIKRGYLNLLHAREAISRTARDAAASIPPRRSVLSRRDT